uniref:Uncharacterized protein n=1 Tax=Arundo donax TaxID=35708 RepID=A0A0A9AWK8_ARUDO
MRVKLSRKMKFAALLFSLR